MYLVSVCSTAALVCELEGDVVTAFQCKLLSVTPCDDVIASDGDSVQRTWALAAIGVFDSTIKHARKYASATSGDVVSRILCEVCADVFVCV